MIAKISFPGILFTCLVAAIALIISVLFPFFNSILIGMLLGILIGNFFKLPSQFSHGISLIGTKMLEFSILFLAFGINYSYIGKIGWESFLIVAFVVFVVLFLSVYLSKKMNCPSTVGWMIGFGTAICGSSAIAALAPSISKNKEDVGVALAVVNLFGTIGMLFLPLVLTLFSFSSIEASMLLGGTLHSVGNVAGAAFSISPEIGEQSITIKLARVALLSPGLIFFSYLTQDNKGKNWKNYFQLPWYLWGFILVTILVSIINIPTNVVNFSEVVGKILLTIAMTAIGLKVSFSSLITSGKKGLFYGFLIFIIQIILILLGIIFLLN
ncbi:MAG: putative sulfate exporter family transporter [Flavobacterium sp.]|nr:putative sulfate exporter family transporter [Flavobacterium sp.]